MSSHVFNKLPIYFQWSMSSQATFIFIFPDAYGTNSTARHFLISTLQLTNSNSNHLP